MSVDAISNSSGLAAMLAGQLGNGSPTAAQLAADRQALMTSNSSTTSGSASSTTSSLGSGLTPAKAATPAEIKKVSSQFEAIILRQMLAPTIEPIMSGGSGGSGSDAGGGGAGVYGYMVTDVLANSMSKGGGFGIAKILEKQLSPKHSALTSSDNSSTN
jgi:flagellar protein FlgJ